MKEQRLSKVLAAGGVASRRRCEELIFEGKVTVGGQIVLVPQTLVDPSVDDIRFEDRRIRIEQSKVYYLLNKPTGYICSNKPLGRKKRVIDLLPQDKRLFTVGRLDRDTTGLLILTNDGHFCQEVIHPRANIEKEYLVKTVQEVDDTHLKSISRGAFVDGIFVKPVSVRKVRKGTIKVVVKEGRKREVRVFVLKAGLKILSLTRIRIGGLLLGGLALGAYKLLEASEREALFTR